MSTMGLQVRSVAIRTIYLISAILCGHNKLTEATDKARTSEAGTEKKYVNNFLET